MPAQGACITGRTKGRVYSCKERVSIAQGAGCNLALRQHPAVPLDGTQKAETMMQIAGILAKMNEDGCSMQVR